jgi:hypothetical protein
VSFAIASAASAQPVALDRLLGGDGLEPLMLYLGRSGNDGQSEASAFTGSPDRQDVERTRCGNGLARCEHAGDAVARARAEMPCPLRPEPDLDRCGRTVEREGDGSNERRIGGIEAEADTRHRLAAYGCGAFPSGLARRGRGEDGTGMSDHSDSDNDHGGGEELDHALRIGDAREASVPHFPADAGSPQSPRLPRTERSDPKTFRLHPRLGLLVNLSAMSCGPESATDSPAAMAPAVLRALITKTLGVTARSPGAN